MKKIIELKVLYDALSKVYTRIINEINEKIASIKTELDEKITANTATIETNTATIKTNTATITANTAAITANTEEIAIIKNLITTENDITVLSNEYLNTIE